MTFPKIAFAALILGCAMTWPSTAPAESNLPAHERLAQVPAPAGQIQPSPPAATQPRTPTTPQSTRNPIGTVATLQGSATVTRNNAASLLKRRDMIFKGDMLQTDSNGTLGVTFDDETTFTLNPNSRIAVDNFVYQEGGASNVAVFNIVRGTVVFVASKVAKTGNMQVETPSATLGIRGTTGIVEISESGPAASQVFIKLYPDADGRVGRIEVLGRDGAQLGILSRGATGFVIQPGPPGAPQQFSAVPLQISAQDAERDRAFVSRTFSAQIVGRQINIQRRNLRRPNLLHPNRVSPRTPLRPPQRLNLLPPTGQPVAPTLLQPFPGTLPPDVPQPLPGTLPPAAPPGVPSLPGTLPPSAPPTVPTLPRLPGRLPL